MILIPGFFAFAGLGDLHYWHGVDTALLQAFKRFGLDVDILEIETQPTASIRYRAMKVLDAIRLVAARDEGPIHLIGHSTGGLDARLAISPHASHANTIDPAVLARVASIVTVATPHYGTPLASTFGSVMGQPLLRWLAKSAIIGLERGKLPLSTFISLAGILVRLDDVFGLQRTVLDQLYAQLFREFNDARREALIAFLDDVSKDRALVVQLTPDTLDLFNATTAAPLIDHGCVVTRGRRPNLRRVAANLSDAYAQALYALYSSLWFISSTSDGRFYPELDPAQRAALLAGYGSLPKPSDNDGMSPTLSQVWGEVVHVTDADHLDVMGQYGDLLAPGINADWLPSGSGFDAVRFAALWNDVAAFVTRTARQEEAAGAGDSHDDRPDSSPAPKLSKMP
ncbi:MAG: triacylglycerol lipase [Polyangiales bacterium]